MPIAFFAAAFLWTHSGNDRTAALERLGAPAGSKTAQVVPGGVTILPNGRFVTPVGDRLYTGEDLWNVIVSPDGGTVVGLPDGALDVYGPDGHRTIAHKEQAPCGVFSADGSTFIGSEGDEGELAFYDAKTWAKGADVKLNLGDVKDTYINDLVLSKDGSKIYALDIANQQIVTLDSATKSVLGRVKAGREPYAIALSEDGARLYVANIGLFDYSLIPGGISHPAFAFPSENATSGVDFEGKRVPGLGPEHTPDAQSVWEYDLADGSAPKLAHTATSGLLLHAPSDNGQAVGGSAPNALAVRGNVLYVSNANSDTVQAFRLPGLKSLYSVKLSPSPLVSRLRGVIPSGLAVTKDGSRVYVCESGLNAVATIDTKTRKVVGHIPTGWFPMQLRLSPDEKTLYVATQKGIGRGPRGAYNPRPKTDERYGLAEMPGMIERVAAPSDTDLVAGTQTVLQNNGLDGPLTRPVSFPPQIKHVVYIIKENHTFDGIFGQLQGADGEPRYAEWGDPGWIHEKGKDAKARIMPNHLKLARQFAISDNFYMEPQASGDGHRWLIGVYPSLWTSRVFYSGWGFRFNDKAKGRLVSFGSNASEIPEDYLENGSLWEHLGRGNVSFRNYGEGFEFPEVGEDEPKSRTGAVEPTNIPMPKILFDNTCFEFPIFNTNIPDIAKIDWFKEDVQKTFRSKGKDLPAFMDIALSNDHGTEARPKWGYPYVCSYMADNDLALGRVVEYLSHTPEWKSMVIFVTQDDSGGDNDHVDRHRSFVMAIGPWVKHGYVSHEHTSIMSIVRSIYTIFGLGPNNMFDALATPLDDMFTTTPDFTPYSSVDSDPLVFRAADTIDPDDPKFEKRRKEAGVAMDDPAFIRWMEKRSDGGK